MLPPILRLRKNEDIRLLRGHLWVFSNEVDVKHNPLANYTPGELVNVETAAGRFIGTAYFNPHSLICARILTRQPNTPIDQHFFSQRIQTACELRQQIFPEPYYRLIYGESDLLPGLVVDQFNDTLVVQTNTLGMEQRLPIIINSLRDVIKPKHILIKNDSSIRQLEQLENYVSVAHGQPPEIISIIENDTKFFAPLLEGQKTGWFYDHRLNRARLKDHVKNKRVLDVFSYLGGWGIQAAKFGAKEVTCIDSSALACDFISKNAALNQVEERVSTICEDAFKALQQLHHEKQKFDVVILDPPAFIKKRKDVPQGKIAYQRLNQLALRLLNPGGILVSASCSMHLQRETFLQILTQQMQSPHFLQILEQGHQGPDHPIHPAIPETEYLKAFICRWE